MKDIFLNAPTEVIEISVLKTEKVINKYQNIVCSVSGGSDSDIMIDICNYYDSEGKIKYIFINTGIEMAATKKHIKTLEEKYGIKIKEIKPKIPVPLAVKKYGVPFHSKIFSEYISRLQKHGFKWEDKPFDELYEEYPNCKAALRWWCNMWGDNSMSNISSAKYLKEFMIKNPPDFLISNKCCECGKKKPAKAAQKNADIVLLGIRKKEGGARAIKYTSCLHDGKDGLEHFPLFWWSDDDKVQYCKKFDVTHSDAYTQYGCKRTGCAGCPFGSKFEDELNMLETYEPRLYAAVCNIFGKSYDYTRKYRKFKECVQQKNAPDAATSKGRNKIFKHIYNNTKGAKSQDGK